MFGFRSRSRLVAPQMPHGGALDGNVGMIGTPGTSDGSGVSLVPCNNLRGHWVVGPEGKLELRWELDAPVPVTPLKLRRPIPPHGGERRTA